VGASVGLAFCQRNGPTRRLPLLPLTLALGRPWPPVPAAVRPPRLPPLALRLLQRAAPTALLLMNWGGRGRI